MLPITIYTTPTCPYCWAAKRLLNKKNLEFTEINVAWDPVTRSQMREKAGGRNTVPQIWIGQNHIGGSDDLHALEITGELDRLLMSLNE